MDPQTIFLPAKPRVPRKRRHVAPPAVAPLTLVAAEYQEDTWVRLTFDRAIDIAGLDAAQVVVNDSDLAAARYRGSGAGTLLSPTTVQIALVETTGTLTPGITLTAGGATGIVAQDDGGSWAGVTDLELPYP